MSERQFQFKLEEYKSLRGEIDTRIKESFALVIYCVTAIAAIYGTFVAAALSDKGCANHNTELARTVFWAAVAFPICGLIKSIEAWDITLRIAAHLRKFEASLGLHGWEYLADLHRKEQDKPLWYWLTKPPYLLFWLLLIAITVGVRLSL